MDSAIALVFIASALLLGLAIGWSIAQLATASARERAGSAEGRILVFDKQLSNANTELENVRRMLEHQSALAAKAEAERDAALQQCGHAELRWRAVESSHEALRGKLADAEKQVVQKSAAIESANNQTVHLQQQLAERSKQLSDLQSELQGSRDEVRGLQEERAQLREKNGALELVNSRKDQELLAQKQWFEEQSAHLQTLFARTANDLLEEKAANFGHTNKEQIESLMKPLEGQLREFRMRVDQLHTVEVGAQARLEEQISNLAHKASAVGATADNLANAMLGNAKKQGNWGELQLSVLLEQAGFVKGKHFDEQVHGLDDDKDRRYADIVLRLPKEECLVIDSKLTLPSWVDFCSTSDPEARKAALAGIVSSMRKHYERIAEIDYARIISKTRSIPFTLMFIPIEAAGTEAFRAAPELFVEAQKRKVIMVTPTTLFCVLQLVVAMWGLHDRQLNALNIAEHGRLLLRKLSTFLGSFKAVGDSLAAAVGSYESAKGQLQTGRGNLVSIADRMSKLGVEVPADGELTRIIDSGELVVEAMPKLVAQNLDSRSAAVP